MILVLRRNNPSPDGDLLDMLVSALSAAGYQIQYVDVQSPQALRVKAKVKDLTAGLVRHQNIPSIMKKRLFKNLFILGLKITVHLRSPNGIWPFFKEKYSKHKYLNPDYVREVINGTRSEPVHLIAQSAGGITAALVSSHPKVKSLLCIGYPLKYPNKKPQKYRTKPLQSISAPCLIVQGDKDEYGAISDIRKYKISNNVKFLEIMADHSYKNITDEDMAKVYQAVVQLIQRGDAPNSYPVC